MLPGSQTRPLILQQQDPEVSNQETAQNQKPTANIHSAFKSLVEILEGEEKRLGDDITSLQNTKSLLEAEIKQMSGLKRKWDTVVKLNVGGKPFATSKSNLTQHSNSMLGVMFSGRYELPVDDQNQVFIDRNPKAFAWIVDFLRDGEQWEKPTDPVMLRKVKKEFDFFQLPFPETSEEREEREKQERFQQFLASGFHDSLLLENPAHKRALCEWVEPDAWKLLYRGTRDGFQFDHFLNLCCDKGATITVMKCTSGYVFGGYASSSWLPLSRPNESFYIHDAKAFLFTLKNPHGVVPTRLAVKDPNNALFMSHNTIAFGDGPDLCASISISNKSGSSYFPISYENTTGKNGLFTNSTSFQLAEMEVFGVSK